MNFEYGSRHNSHQSGQSHGHDRQDSYDGNYQVQQPIRYERNFDDRSHSGHRVQSNNFMPPRYPQANYGKNSHMDFQASNNFMMLYIILT